MPATYLYHPLHLLKPIGKNIWIADGGEIRMAFPLGIKIPFSTRMTIVRLSDGGLWCHSPIAPTPKLLAQTNALGEVRHLVSPNKIHYAHIAAWQAHYPQASAWASAGVRERAAKQGIAVSFTADLGDDAPSAWAHDLAQMPFAGSRVMTETVFFHHASRTLILTDLIENFETDQFHSRFWARIMKLAGIADPDGKAPADWRATFKDKAAARACLAQMLAWQPEKVILAHGRCYESNVVAELKRAFRWLD
ncbi:DUF4336 domain-containing protein [Kingella sp. (in: b-proteobacteria)]|uniref:DUF4336 domain-containing protein n=1 Tax=Kingella sp. (in: b-proteobacteria) TaxID=2020713 RepID=UPI0026DB4486|nr:DUF4336 domain-containing protein [Kingella sp. (in: b-proteobacteria)]MDO4658432.1 DUF4336 domain-containing protein [Kingella sp. (in: b-proteobacteria)]